MNHTDFNKIVKNRLNTCEDTLCAKNEEYSSDTDRLHNFVTAGRINNVTPEKALWGMYTKHLVSVMDMVADPSKVTVAVLSEKMTASINYHLLLEGILVEYLRKGDRNRVKEMEKFCDDEGIVFEEPALEGQEEKAFEIKDTFKFRRLKPFAVDTNNLPPVEDPIKK
ncbi:unnamed protein product, partial [marine sediment metagenome]